MSFSWKPPIYNVKGRERNWLNTIFTAHDGFCGCENPPEHLLLLLCREARHLELTKENYNTAQKCLGYTEDQTTTHTDAEPSTAADKQDTGDNADIDSYDLETLFAEDTESAG